MSNKPIQPISERKIKAGVRAFDTNNVPVQIGSPRIGLYTGPSGDIEALLSLPISNEDFKTHEGREKVKVEVIKNYLGRQS